MDFSVSAALFNRKELMSQHIVPMRVYFVIFFVLMILTATTVWVAFFDLGAWNDVVALGIASSKGMLVILYFMHVRYSSRLTWIFASVGFLFLIILLAFTMSDVLTRDWIPVSAGWVVGHSRISYCFEHYLQSNQFLTFCPLFPILLQVY